MESARLHICCNIDDNYAQHCGVMLTSLFEKTKGSNLTIHILISTLSRDNENALRNLITIKGAQCHFHKVNSEALKGVKLENERRILSEATYYRIFMSSILDKSISKVLYLDSDMIVLQDIAPLFSIDLTGYALAAAKDLIRLTDENRFELSLPYTGNYFNAGLMLVNLDYWRENNAENDLIVFTKKERRMNNHDQDALNAVFREKWFKLSPRWNRFYPYIYDNSFFENERDKVAFDKNPVIIHYLDHFKPWNRISWVGSRWNKYRGLYYKYLALTPWKDFKPGKFDIEKYTKFGLYKYLVLTSTRGLFINIYDFIREISKSTEKFIFLPFMILFKIYYHDFRFKHK